MSGNRKSEIRNQKLKRNGFIVLYFLFAFLTAHFSFLISYSLAEQSQKLKIGVVGPETGDDAETGLMTLAGIELAAKDINGAGGVDGKKIEVIHYDNKSNPQLTQAVVQKMVQEKVVAIIASPTGWSTFGPVWIANAAKVIFMSAGSKRHIGRSGPFIFRNSLSDDIGTEETIQYAVDKLKYKNFAVITSMRDDETSLQIGGLFRGAIIKKGAKIVSETHLFMGATIEEAISQLKKDTKEPIDAVIFAGDDAAAVDVLQEMRKQGIKAPLIGGDILFTDEFLKRGNELTVGTIIYAGFFPADKSRIVSMFVSEYKKKTGKRPGIYPAVAYDSLMLIVNAIRQAKSTEPVKLRDTLAKTKDFMGVTGKITMDANGEAIKQPYILQAVKKGGKVEFELVGGE
ncbi:MAG: ABC transporter substrate-binding protein [Deltaproteobacteria bacterium]|nr:ABC transporter substrate-binding protein [Deltaproteobacteria bacterium]